MKIFELLETGTVGTVGSNPAGGTVPPSTPTSPTTPTPQDPNKPPGQQSQTNKTDPNLQMLASTLKSGKIIQTDKEINDFVSAWQAQQSGKTLNPAQQDMLAKLGPALIANKNLDTKLDTQLKAMSQVKPGIGTPQ